jgi:hypothetical protein
MKATSRLDRVLDAAEKLTLPEREQLVEVLKRQVIEQRREEIASEIASARREHANGKSRVASVDDLMREIRQ